jgi:K+-sensing histidine kinase KdpD
MSTNNHRVERLYRELNALTEIAKTLNLHLELPVLLETVLKKIVGVIEPADLGAVMLWDQSAGLFRPIASIGYDLEILSNLGLRAGESITGKVYDEGVGCLLNSVEQVVEAMADMRPTNRLILEKALGSQSLPCCALAVPIIVGNKKYGVLVLETLQRPVIFSQEDLPFLQIIADLIALAIDRVFLAVQADAIREARQRDWMHSEVMAMLSHELRLPLTAIQGYTSALLLDDVEWDEEKRNEFLRLIDEECHSMQAMLKDILDSSLIEVEQLIIEPQPVRIQNLAREVAAEVQLRTDLHNIIVDFPAEFPILEADPRWIKQVFRNIFDNAVKYSPEGGLIVVRGEIRSKDVVIMLADQGIGISPEDLIPLFEKYFRVRSAVNLHVSGTGLGLPISRVIVELHGGRIWAESKQGEGTTIYFSLPLSKALTEE